MVFGFLMTLITTLSITKSQQLLSALHADKLRALGRSFISETMEVFILFLLLLIQIVIGSVSLAIIRPRVLTTKIPEDLCIDFSCNTELHLDVQLCYVMLLAIYCVIQGVRARKVPKYFNETFYIALSMGFTVALIAIKFPSTEAFRRGMVRTFVNAIMLSLINLVQMVTMFGPKVRTLLSSHHRKKLHVFLFRTSNNSYRASTRKES